MRVLINLIVGSRAFDAQSLGSDFNFRRVVYYGDQRDLHGTSSQFTDIGTISTWPYNHFINRALRFQFEALELLFPSPSNLIQFDPILLPIYQIREKIICHDMLDRVVDRARLLLRQSLRRNGKALISTAKAVQAIEIVRSVIAAISGGGGIPLQGDTPSSESRSILSHKMGGEEIKCRVQNYIRSIESQSLNPLRRPTPRERARGEEPQSSLPYRLRSQLRKEFLNLSDRIWKDIQASDPKEIPERARLEVDRFFRCGIEVPDEVRTGHREMNQLERVVHTALRHLQRGEGGSQRDALHLLTEIMRSELGWNPPGSRGERPPISESIASMVSSSSGSRSSRSRGDRPVFSPPVRDGNR